MEKLNLKDKKLKKQIEDIMALKIILYDCFGNYDDYKGIINRLNDLKAEQVITSEEYNFIMAHYEEWLKDWEERK